MKNFVNIELGRDLKELLKEGYSFEKGNTSGNSIDMVNSPGNESYLYYGDEDDRNNDYDLLTTKIMEYHS